MISVPVILSVMFLGGLLAWLANRFVPKGASWTAVLVMAFAGYLVFALPACGGVFNFQVGTMDIMWKSTTYSSLFAMLVAVLGFLGLLYSMDFMAGKKNLGYYYMNFLFTLGAMLGIVYSQDLVSLFFFWEIMTWSSFMLVIYSGKKEAHKAGIKYFAYSAIGAYFLLSAIVILYAKSGSFALNENIAVFPQMGVWMQVLVITFLSIGFGVKSAMMPLHVWAPEAYGESPSGFTAVFSGALSKMGIFGLGLVLFKFAANTEIFVWVKETLAWLGGLTAMLATFYAVFQKDSKKLLAYSSIGQLGYIIVGLALGTPLGIMAALFLTIMHGAFKAMLFMSAGAVYMRTGTTDMTEVNGLITKMPLTFLTALFGIISVAGIPPLGGFISKWMLYQALLESKHYFLIIVIFIASTAAFLYLYRFIFSLFLGQREKEVENIKEAPLSMIIPMMFLVVFVLVAGVVPGTVLDPIGKAMGYLGNFKGSWEPTVVFSAWGEEINMQVIATTIGVIFILGAIFIGLKGKKSTRLVSTKDIHTSGEVPAENENLTYAVNFNQPFERALGPLLKLSVDKLFNLIGINLESTFEYLRYVYTGNGQTYAMYVILMVVILILFSGSIFGIHL
jgi:NADH-quinone oxidoreductase subunit M